MTDEQRPAKSFDKASAARHAKGLDSLRISLTGQLGTHDQMVLARASDMLSAWPAEPNSDASLSEIARQPATKREETLVELLFYQNPIDIPKVGTIRTTAVDGDRCVWRINSLRHGSHGPFDTLAAALAHAEQLAEQDNDRS